ncbi:DNA polymerase III subunit alpha [Wenjunlia tyrosinilytica]|uniref:DNA polymerase III subunit alpha n=1 Tax=Wenjunlia tyrosinilytica TaxID=1544741 RepID=A0A918E0R3_9ACTN|nr:DNA polymerase III subunit alpha [Wenjunlia tyrosinilytica]GGO95408.1 DNA-directed DNA polymerase [Wenjunlia tyrosinilytica]
MSGFTHLHVASGFSLRYGASHPEQLVERAVERGLGALALTDRDGVAGAVRFTKACREAGVRPLLGVELAVAPFKAAAATAPRRRTPVKGGAFIDESRPRVVLLARDDDGWAALCRLVGAAHSGGAPRPVLSWEDLRRHATGGLTVLLGPDSEPVRALAAGRQTLAEELLAPWREVFEDALRLEAVHHGRTGTDPGSLRLAARTTGFAAQHGLPAVLANAVRYADSDQGPVADVLDAARRLVPIDRRRLDTGERWLKGPSEMAWIAERVAEGAGQDHGGAARLLDATERTAEECAAQLRLGKPYFPEPELVGADRRTAVRVLRSRCTAEVLRRRLDGDREIWNRLDDELGVIGDLGYATYFLTVARVVDDVRAMGIRVAARGSGAGSLVNHLLGIANANPVEHGLLMERFLSRKRKALPDIDIDVESARRLEVYRKIFERFGEERVATVAMPETYRVRHAIRDVGAALSLDPEEVGRLAKSFPHIRARDAGAALAELPELRDVAARKDRYGRLWELVERLDALPRGIAMHPCGVLLSDASLLRRTPVVPSGEGFPMSQFDKDDVEDLGLLKLDVLGVRMQSAMAHATAEVERETGERVELDALAPTDPDTYRLIRTSETLGCFQIESPGQRDLIGRLQPSTFHDLVVDISLFRPGPVAADMVRPFIESRHGRRPVRYPHADLKKYLEETYGVVVFHEQIIHIIHELTGCGRDVADHVRRALSSPTLQGQAQEWFRRNASRGYGKDVVDHAWEILEAFGSYGFCKAHAVAFAVPTYQSAWLKTHHPAAFYAGVLTHDPGMYPKRVLLADARRHGVLILPLDINRSHADYRVERLDGGGLGLRLALSEVQGISENEVARIVAGQPYSSLQDFWQRARPHRPPAERLVEVGALDPLSGRLTRRDLLLQIAELHHRQAAAANSGQLPIDAERPEPPEPSGLPEMTDAERLSAELSVLGMDASRHLMGDHYALLKELGAVSARRLREVPHGEQVLVAGAKAATQTPPIRSGKRVIFTTLDDGTGLVDCAFFDDSHAACAHTVFHSWLLLIRGTVQRRGPRSLSVVGAMCWNLNELAAAHREGGLPAVRELLARPVEDTAPVPERTISMPTGFEMHPWADLRPAGEGAAGGRKLWHSSPGSAG